MEVDWGDEAAQARWDRRLLGRVLGYFRPYWPKGLAAIACIGVLAALGLVPALVTKGLLDALTRPGARFSQILLLVGAGIAASLVGGLVGVAESWLPRRSARASCSTCAARCSTGCSASRSGSSPTTAAASCSAASTTTSTPSRTSSPTPSLACVQPDRGLHHAGPGGGAGLAADPAGAADGAAGDGADPPHRQDHLPGPQQTQEQYGRITAYLQEVLGISGILLVKAFVAEQAERARFDMLNGELRRLAVRQEMIAQAPSMPSSVRSITIPAMPMVAAAVGARRARSGSQRPSQRLGLNETATVRSNG